MSKTVVITGAGRGLGFALAQTFLNHGWHVIAVIRNPEQMASLQALSPDQIEIVVADLALDSAATVIKASLSTCSKVDLLINNAGIFGKNKSILDENLQDYLDLFNVHCLGSVRATRACLDSLTKSEKPTIVNISSRLGSVQKVAQGDFQHRKLSYSYRVAKAALNMFTASLHQELRPQGFIVVSAHPGQIKTSAPLPDAELTAEEAAERIYEWQMTLKLSDSCEFHEIPTGRLPW